MTFSLLLEEMLEGVKPVPYKKEQGNGFLRYNFTVKGIKFVYFTEKDVVRHHLVIEIINAYGRNENGNLNQKENSEKK